MYYKHCYKLRKCWLPVLYAFFPQCFQNSYLRGSLRVKKLWSSAGGYFLCTYKLEGAKTCMQSVMFAYMCTYRRKHHRMGEWYPRSLCLGHMSMWAGPLSKVSSVNMYLEMVFSITEI